jgi:peptide/nickel transport system substrate-binding protein
MTRRDLFQQQWQNLSEAIRTESISRRTFLSVAGAAAVAMGMSSGAAAAPNPSISRVVSRGQAANNILVYGSGQDIPTLDPHTGHDYSISWGQKAVYDSLLRYDGNPATIVPLLATEVSGNTDATEFTFKLADKAKFHDGSPVTAEAIQYNFQRMLRKNLGVAWMFAEVIDQDSVAIVDPTTIKVALRKPFAPFEAIVPWLFIANPAILQANEVDGDEGETYLMSNEAGSGPYTVTRWEIGSSYEFTKWPEYWYAPPEGVKMVDKLVWQMVRESSTKRIAMETGEVQMTDYLTVEDYEALGAAGFTPNTEGGLGTFSVKLNNQVGPTADINVRKALQLAFDYDAGINSVNGYAAKMRGAVPPNLKPWFKEDLPEPTFDIEAAKAALAASGYPDGFDLEYVYVTGLATEEQIGLILLEKAAELNINVQMVPLVWPDMVARAADQATSPGAIAIFGAVDYNDPDNWLWPTYHSSQAGSWSASAHYKNAEFDALLEQGRSTIDPVARKATYDQAQQKLVDDAAEIWVYTPIDLMAWVSELDGQRISQVMGADMRGFGYK